MLRRYIRRHILPLAVIGAALAVIICSPASCRAAGADQDFNVSDGHIERAADGRYQVRSNEMRATLKTKTPESITVHFTYVGPSEQVSHLASGELRHQFGLKLRAQDICNLIYVMWHFDSADSGVHVLVKSNPGQQTHEQCLDRGYINNIPASYTAPSPSVRPDQPHTLKAVLHGRELSVTADNALVWKGNLPAAALSFDGPLGFRSDNAHVVFDYSIGK